MARANVLGPLRWKRAKIHRGSRRRKIGPHHEAGYTSAVVTEPEFVKAVAIGRGPYTSTYDLMDKDVDDASHVPTLLDQLTQDPASFMADGAYDRAATYDAILARSPSARFIVPSCKGSVPGPTETISPTQRDLHVLAVDEYGRMNWKKASGYNTRSKVEAAISRYKHVIGDTLKSRHDTRRATEVAIAIKSLNRMNQLGRAIFTRIA